MRIILKLNNANPKLNRTLNKVLTLDCHGCSELVGDHMSSAQEEEYSLIGFTLFAKAHQYFRRGAHGTCKIVLAVSTIRASQLALRIGVVSP